MSVVLPALQCPAGAGGPPRSLTRQYPAGLGAYSGGCELHHSRRQQEEGDTLEAGGGAGWTRDLNLAILLGSYTFLPRVFLSLVIGRL